MFQIVAAKSPEVWREIHMSPRETLNYPPIGESCDYVPGVPPFALETICVEDGWWATAKPQSPPRRCPPLPLPPSPSPSPSIAGPVHSRDEILAHPRFAAARAAFVEAVLAAHEGDRFRNRLLVEAMRQVTFNVIVSLHLRYDPADRTTWPTPRRLKDELATFGLASTRRIDALVSRFIQLGYVESPPLSTTAGCAF